MDALAPLHSDPTINGRTPFPLPPFQKHLLRSKLGTFARPNLIPLLSPPFAVRGNDTSTQKRQERAVRCLNILVVLRYLHTDKARAKSVKLIEEGNSRQENVVSSSTRRRQRCRHGQQPAGSSLVRDGGPYD